MVRAAKKWGLLAVTAYLVFAVLGMSVLVDSSVKDLVQNPAKGAFLSSTSYPVEYLAVARTKDNSFSPHNCPQRMPAGFSYAGTGEQGAAPGGIFETSAKTAKNNILLKLRI
ncbi:MAG: hypothetical protein LBJ31_09370 [Treponema sp.]|jgi:hypothetical protein|nr:hypothetical protein [Treponema sp.]